MKILNNPRIRNTSRESLPKIIAIWDFVSGNIAIAAVSDMRPQRVVIMLSENSEICVNFAVKYLSNGRRTASAKNRAIRFVAIKIPYKEAVNPIDGCVR